MSTTPAAEITVPREFLRAFLYAVGAEIVSCAGAIEETSTLAETEQPWRRLEDEVVAGMDAALKVRAVVLRACDQGTPIPAAVVREHVAGAIEYFNPDFDESSTSAEIRRDLIAWGTEHGFVNGEREAATA